MTEKMIRDAYALIRTTNNTTPDDVLDFMKDASIEKLNEGSLRDRILSMLSSHGFDDDENTDYDPGQVLFDLFSILENK